jgi:hypothetical protein
MPSLPSLLSEMIDVSKTLAAVRRACVAPIRDQNGEPLAPGDAIVLPGKVIATNGAFGFQAVAVEIQLPNGQPRSELLLLDGRQIRKDCPPRSAATKAGAVYDDIFKYKIGDAVQLKGSSEHGEIIGRANFEHQDNTYLVRYRAGDGRLVETWWTDEALETKSRDLVESCCTGTCSE